MEKTHTLKDSPSSMHDSQIGDNDGARRGFLSRHMHSMAKSMKGMNIAAAIGSVLLDILMAIIGLIIIFFLVNMVIFTGVAMTELALQQVNANVGQQITITSAITGGLAAAVIVWSPFIYLPVRNAIHKKYRKYVLQ